jgi:type II secretory pathway component PulF
MPLFQYKAKNLTGELVFDIIEAENVKIATNKLQSAGFYPILIVPHIQKDTLTNRFTLFKVRNIRHKDVVMFTRQLADSLKGGLPLARALAVLENQTENRFLAVVIKEISLSIKEGKSFSQTLKNYPELFSVMFIAMVEAGETAGILDVVLLRLAGFDEKEEEVRYRLYSTLAYPMIMLLVGMVSVIFLLSFVIPRFEVMFQDIGQSMPAPTKILILTSHVLRYGWWVYVPVLLVLTVVLRKWYLTEQGKLFFSNIKLKLPIIGDFIRKDIISRFIRMLSILLANGIPILDTLIIARNSIDNQIFSNDINRIFLSVKEGQGLSKPLKQSSLFPPMVSEMIAVGEETGNLESSLVRIAEIYELEVEYAVKTMMSLLEPVIILFAGVVVCFVAISMLLPVFQVSAGFR